MVINQELYNRLKQVFGGVSVVNPGVQAGIQFDFHPVIGQDTRVSWWIPDGAEKGEQYAVRCPYCMDHGRHLYISHTSYMIPRTDRGAAIPGKLLVNCFHGCFNNHPERYAELDSKLKLGSGYTVVYSEPKEESSKYSDKTTVSGVRTWCPTYNTMDSATSDVISYIQSRGYSLEYMQAMGVGWGPVVSLSGSKTLNNGSPFLIFPIIQNGHLRGFQARACVSKEECERRGFLRWYIHPGCKKSSVIYNIDQASNHPVCVLTEGIFGVLRIGPCGIATFGPAPSAFQEKLIAARWSKGALIWVPDTKISPGLNPVEKAAGIIERYNRNNVFACGAHMVTIPAKDPDEMSKEDLWAEITRQTGDLLTRKIWNR